MNYLLAPLTAGAYVIAVEDAHTWDVTSYTNLYVLQRNGQTILIDAGLKAYQPAIIEALSTIGIEPDMVTHVLLTHGHHDHAEGSDLFKNARKFVHSADWPMLAVPLCEQFTRYTPLADKSKLVAEGLNELEIMLVNTHSPGSVAIFDHISKALFVGDFFCYFGEALPGGELVDYCEYCRQGSCQYVAGQAEDGSAEFGKFIEGLSRLIPFQSEFFCTGHGIVLRDDIQTFVKSMWLSGTQSQQE
ncbi:MBL fold metallo-hydrolase [Sporomusa malonica]|uniref:Metallo-beta-lactamase superfamily protein n=1 Tax=Sporomusa malonica TaxID=112901 RepID=A0A1W1ZSP1_9FIRM|nr:MBL fold metallo-hydrolase [Sporomusa malonica]SMC51088.1 Metallo-beta-lactamase superfamily protein [Sporomusa malonica]